MRQTLPIVAVALLGLGWSFSAQAEEATPHPTHPADPTQVYRRMDAIDPFALAVPLLNREIPTPSYGGVPSLSGQVTPPEADMMPGMDHGNMPGMDHSNMPGMSGN
ncbi:MAG: hypothetical protein JNL25_17310 [Rhodospirillaceae bacterium]|nr:hypothetical protein [Rhodospirillaceae bacterium]